MTSKDIFAPPRSPADGPSKFDGSLISGSISDMLLLVKLDNHPADLGFLETVHAPSMSHIWKRPGFRHILL